MSDEREQLGTWFDVTTEGVVLPAVLGLSLLGGFIITLFLAAFGYMELGARYAYNRLK